MHQTPSETLNATSHLVLLSLKEVASPVVPISQIKILRL